MEMASVGPSEGSEAAGRRERAAIAAQACQTCRTRKSKCDEQRPKCGLCRRLNVECEYREPAPTKKDKTMVHILEALNRLENKFDSLSFKGLGSSDFNSPPDGAEFASPAGSLAKQSSTHDTSTHERNAHPNLKEPYQHVTVPHKVLLWPGIYLYLIHSGIPAASDLHRIVEEGTAWFIRREVAKQPDPLPCDVSLPASAITPTGLGQDQVQTSNIAFPTLRIQNIQEHCDAYFNTFNVLYPLLNRESFMNDVVAKLLRNGYADGDAGSVLALLVYALGQVAIEGVFGAPIASINGKPSGFRGGTASHPPGLPFFNEARRRLGFLVTTCSLENVQILLLQATYYEATARHLDFWRSTTAASMACQVLVRCHPIDWTSPYGDLIRRAYWTCVLSEDLYHVDLDLPQTGVHKLEDEVPLPYFHGEPGQTSAPGSGAGPASQQPSGQGSFAEERSHYQYHFLAMIALRRLISRIHGVIYECERAANDSEPLWREGANADPRQSKKEAQAETPSTSTPGAPLPGASPSQQNYAGPPVAVIREMVRQLDSWRALLPRPLQWSDADKLDFPVMDFTARRPNESLFNHDQGPIPIGHKFNLDIVSAQLRTRFYYARFIIYRPFIYKALHFPELMSADDCNCCAHAIKSACMWPLAMAPPKNKKRLVPHLFAWTQNFIAILLIFKMCTENDCLRSIVQDGNMVSQQEIDMTAMLMLEWVRDVQQLDGTAEWSWQILEALYGLDGKRSSR